MKLEYHNGSGLLAVVGDPIAHSLSPLLQNAMLEELGEDLIYLAFRVPGEQIGDFAAAAKLLGIRGYNLTMPHKERIIPYLDSMTPEARAAMSVNSVRMVDGRLEGHSTDGIGFRRSLEIFGQDFPGRRVTILGAGGAAKSVALTAHASGAECVRVVNRTVSRAEQLCAGRAGMTAHGFDELPELLEVTDILINSTPIGMSGTSGGSIPPLEALKPGALAMDCIYAPAMTPFMEAAAALGHPVGNGIGMLVYQAVYALEFFLCCRFTEEEISRLGERLLQVSGISPTGAAT